MNLKAPEWITLSVWEEKQKEGFDFSVWLMNHGDFVQELLRSMQSEIEQKMILTAQVQDVIKPNPVIGEYQTRGDTILLFKQSKEGEEAALRLLKKLADVGVKNNAMGRVVRNEREMKAIYKRKIE